MAPRSPTLSTWVIVLSPNSKSTCRVDMIVVWSHPCVVGRLARPLSLTGRLQWDSISNVHATHCSVQVEWSPVLYGWLSTEQL